VITQLYSILVNCQEKYNLASTIVHLHKTKKALKWLQLMIATNIEIVMPVVCTISVRAYLRTQPLEGS